MSVLNNSNAIEVGGYSLQKSLRFRSSASAYLSRTPASATNQTTWTWSGWVKRGQLAASNTYQVVFGCTVVEGTGYTTIQFDNNDRLAIWHVFGAANQWGITTTQNFRDPSAWYHIVFVLDTNNATQSERIRLYVNGQRVTAYASSVAASLGASSYINSTNAHAHGRYGSSQYFDGYLAEVNFIDGQALTPSSFGQTDATSGAWVPKKYAGTYGTNGFYLPFTDTTSTTTLVADKSGNGNNWTGNNISLTAGATYDSMTDVPTLTSATAANYCVLNPLNKGDNTTIVDGNLKATVGAASQGRTAVGSVSMKTGKWYWEVTGLANITADRAFVGITADYANISGSVVIGYQSYSYAYTLLGDKLNNSVGTAYGATYTNNDVIGVALNMDNGELTFYKNGVSQGVAFTVNTTIGYVAAVCGTSATQPQYAINFGQRPFSYTPPTGFVALNTFNLPDPTIKKPNQYMDATLYTGNGTTNAITNAGSFQPDLVWMKNRASAYYHGLYDSVRGTGTSKSLYSNTTEAEGTNSTNQNLVSFNSNGFTLGATSSTNAINTSGQNHVGWQWKESAAAGFDIVTYTGNYNGSTGTQTIAHNLGVAPKMIIVKNRSSAFDWAVGHASIGWSQAGNLNLTNSFGASSYFNSTAPTSSVFSVGLSNISNQNSSTHVAYLFAEIAGFSKFGSYTGNGSSDGSFIYCGFRPKYVLQKRVDSSNDWYHHDTAQNPYNVAVNNLLLNTADSQGTAYNWIDITSNGFKCRTSDGGSNASGGTYIYAAFAENPFKYANAR